MLKEHPLLQGYIDKDVLAKYNEKASARFELGRYHLDNRIKKGQNIGQKRSEYRQNSDQ